MTDLWKRLDGGTNKGCLKSNTFFFCFDFRGSVKETTINVGIAGYAEIMKWKAKKQFPLFQSLVAHRIRKLSNNASQISS